MKLVKTSHTGILIYNNMEHRVLLEKLILVQQVKKFPACYGAQTFITVHTTAQYLTLTSES
jgi:hypothetical protein